MRRLETERASSALPEPKPVGRQSNNDADKAVARAVLAENAGSELTPRGLAGKNVHRLEGRGDDRTKRLRLSCERLRMPRRDIQHHRTTQQHVALAEGRVAVGGHHEIVGPRVPISAGVPKVAA